MHSLWVIERKTSSGKWWPYQIKTDQLWGLSQLTLLQETNKAEQFRLVEYVRKE